MYATNFVSLGWDCEGLDVGQVTGNFGPVRQNLANVFSGGDSLQKKRIDTRCISASIMRHFRKKSSQSSTPTNSRPSTPTPPAEYIKKELATFFPRAKDRRALAASSSAIALSIVSASCNPCQVAPDESASPKESVWRAVYGAARIAVETAKESSDMLPPLKAVMVALSVLIRNCDVSPPQPPVPLTADCILQQTFANAEQIKDIEDRIESLSKILTYPVVDQDTGEKARTALRKFVFPLQSCTNTLLNQLCPCRALSGIIAKLEPLSKERGLVKFLNNVAHASTLNGFVQDLANAVTDYQVRGAIAQHELPNASDRHPYNEICMTIRRDNQTVITILMTM